MYYSIAPERVTADAAPQLATDLQNLESAFPPVALAGVTETGFTTGLSRILNDYLERRATTISVLAIGTAGLVLVALGVIAVLAALTSSRRRAEAQLWRSRGASTWQLVASRLGEGLTLSLAAALIGFLAAGQLGSEGTNTFPVAAAAALAAAVSAVLIVAAVPTMRRSGAEGRHEVPTPRPAPRRLVAEAVVVATAAGSLVLLRRRGLVAGGESSDTSGFDPLLAMSPALLGLAVGILTVHVYRWLVLPLAWAGARGRRLVAFLGLRRIEMQPPSAHLSLIAILLAVAVAVFASVLRVSVEEGQIESSWLTVGADYRISASSGPPVDALGLADIAGVETTAVGARFNRLSVRGDSSAVPETADLLAVAISDYAAVLSGSPVDPRPGDEMLEGPGTEPTGSEERPIPAIVSRMWAASGPPGPGETFSLRFGAERITFIVAEIRERFAGMPFDSPFIVADLATLRASSPVLGIRPSVAFLRAPEAAAGAIESTVSDLNPAATITSRHELFNDARRDAFSRGVHRSFSLALGLATLFAAVAGIGGLALTAQARRRHFGYLRTLGVTGRQALGLILVEHLPPVVVAAVVGAGLGAASADLYEPGIDLGSFTGRGPVAPLRIELWSVLVVTVGLVVAIMASAGLFVLLTRRHDLGSTVTMGDE
jgi:putative ABC transport system permease protein